MDNKKNRSLVVPLVVISICLLAFGIPFLFSMGSDQSHDDIVLSPRFTPTPTPLDRVLTQQAFANLFFTPTNSQIFLGVFQATSTESFVLSIPITGPTLSFTPTFTPASPTATRWFVFGFPTPTRTNGVFVRPTQTSLPPTSTPTRPSPTNTFTPTKPSPTNTSTPIIIASSTSSPTSSPTSTNSPEPSPTNTSVPPTNTPVPPTDTPVPPTNTPVPPTNTPVPPTDTPAPPTDTPADTPIP